MTNVDDLVQIKIEEARRKIEAARKRRAELDTARRRGLAQRHAQKLRNLAAAEVAQTPTDDVPQEDQPAV